MPGLFAKLFPLERYDLQTERERAQIVYIALFVGLIVLVVYSAVARVWNVEGLGESVTLLNAMVYRADAGLFFLLGWGIIITGYLLVRLGQLEIAKWIPFAALVGLNALVSLLGEPGAATRITEPMTWLVIIAAGGLLANMPGVVAGVLYSLVIMVLRLDPASQRLLPTILLQFLMMTVIMLLIVRQIRISRSEGRALDIDERLKLSEINAEITRKAALHQPLQEILDTTIDLILKNFPQVYHVQIFLIDEERIQARLVASTGEAGRAMLARRHALAIGSQSVIGQCTFTGEVIIARAGVPGSMHRPNPLLPDTLLEAAFPLRVGEQIIGALDLQSRSVSKLSSSEIATFQTLSDSLSLAIADVRQYEVVRAQAQENERLAAQARAALRELEHLNQRLTGQSWADFLHARGKDQALELDLERGQIISAEMVWTPALEQATQKNRIVRQNGTVAVPLRVRGQVIGAMEFELDEANALSEEDLALVEEISERFGLAADNTRLVEQSQRVALREALVNEISSRLQAVNSIESTLREAAHSLADALQARRVQIHLINPSGLDTGESA